MPIATRTQQTDGNSAGSVKNFPSRSSGEPSKATGASGGPVTLPILPTPDPNERKHIGETSDKHFNEDINDIGTKLNSVNNDLFHVLSELQARQSAGLGSAKCHTKALVDSSGNFIVDLLVTGKEKSPGKGVTVERLEKLPDAQKIRILKKLNPTEEFSSLIEPFIEKLLQEAFEARRDDNFQLNQSMDELIDIKSDLMQAVLDSAEDSQDIIDLLHFRMAEDKSLLDAYETEYTDYLTMQLRIAVGLPRSFCHCPPGV
ncbi:hypothetical protein PFICI_05016 [Pestalotiopsis fici W106-1]|uniref:Uncharacterized protein n=1 Tax=Pestalotiopsis fici (strain W106-1 / CGMCC3.15140) TaxID=1229662 RepID=W3XAQ8_PESFW|nr:uncharacterized protein PFICI_05016 [Pestalotiopsis fici W106-1]ETS83140.1 hypothetical protein PFICI_05016 [Pestalotiopsis fici W106-1]